jgi:hypothetical protein
MKVLKKNNLRGQFTLLHNVEIHDLYGFYLWPSFVRAIKPMKLQGLNM